MNTHVAVSDRARRRILITGIFLLASMVSVGVTLFFLVSNLQEERQRLAELREKSVAELATRRTEIENLEQQRVLKQAEVDRLTAVIGQVREKDQAAVRVAEQDVQKQAPRLYIQLADERNLPLITRLAIALRQVGFIVPGIERVRAVPAAPELRYFKKVEVKDANDALAIIRTELPSVTPVYVPGYEDSTRIRPRHLELWF